MAAVFDKPSIRQRMAPMLKGFDGPLAFAVFLLACAGLLTMYSSGYDHGVRFYDHARNMLLAGVIMFIVAQIPPQRLMSFAVPLYVIGVALLVAVAGMAVIFFAGLSWKLIIPPVLLGLIVVALVVIFEPTQCADGFRWPVLHDYQQQRICTLLDPTKDPLGKGFHIIQGMIA